MAAPRKQRTKPVPIQIYLEEELQRRLDDAVAYAKAKLDEVRKRLLDKGVQASKVDDIINRKTRQAESREFTDATEMDPYEMIYKEGTFVAFAYEYIANKKLPRSVDSSLDDTPKHGQMFWANDLQKFLVFNSDNDNYSITSRAPVEIIDYDNSHSPYAPFPPLGDKHTQLVMSPPGSGKTKYFLDQNVSFGSGFQGGVLLVPTIAHAMKTAHDYAHLAPIHIKGGDSWEDLVGYQWNIMTHEKYARHKAPLEGYLLVIDEVHEPVLNASMFYRQIFNKEFDTRAKQLIYTSATVDYEVFGDDDLSVVMMVPTHPINVTLQRTTPYHELLTADASIFIVANRGTNTLWEEVRTDLKQKALAIFSGRLDANGEPVKLTDETEYEFDHLHGTTSITSGVDFQGYKDVIFIDNTQSVQFGAADMAQAINRGRNVYERIIKVPRQAFLKEAFKPNLNMFMRLAILARQDLTVLDYETIQYFNGDPLIVASNFIAESGELMIDEAGAIAYYYDKLKAYHLSNFEALNTYSKKFGVQYIDGFTSFDEEDITVAELEHEDILLAINYDPFEIHRERLKAFSTALKECETMVSLKAVLANTPHLYEEAKKLKILANLEEPPLTETKIYGYPKYSAHLHEKAVVQLAVNNSYGRLKKYNKAIDLGIYDKLRSIISIGTKYTIKGLTTVADAAYKAESPYNRAKLKEFLDYVGDYTYYHKDGSISKNFTASISHISINRIGIYEPEDLVSKASLVFLGRTVSKPRLTA